MVVDIKADVVDGIHRLAALTERLGHMREPYLSHASTLRDPSGPRGPRGPSDTLATMQHETTPPLEINVDLNVDLDVDLNQVERDLADVEAALERLDAGTYWVDEISGADLPEELLTARPTVRRITSA